MASLVESLLNQLGGSNLQQVSQRLGADSATTNAAMSAALPILLGALAKNAATPGGAEALSNALSRDHNGSALDNLPGTLDEAQTGSGSAILGHLLGGRRAAVEQGLAKTTGLDPGAAGSLLTMLAPVVLGALGRAQRQGRMSPTDLAGMLAQEHQGISSGGLGGLLNLLDSNHDGSVIDDVTRLAGKLFAK